MEIEVSMWLPLPDILITAKFSEKSLTLSMRDYKIVAPINENNPAKFTETAIDIISKIEKTVGDIYIDYKKDEDKVKEIKNTVESLLL